MGQTSANPTPPISRDELILRYYPMVQRLARQMGRRYPSSVEVDDLVSIGTMGLIESAERYDPERSGAFTSYARIRIQGAMVDALRQEDWVPRSVRRRHRDLAQTEVDLRRELGRDPTDAEVAKQLGIAPADMDQHRKDAVVRTLVSVEETRGHGDQRISDTLSGNLANPEQAAERAAEHAVLSAALTQLPARDQAILRLYYFETMTLKEIGAVLGVTESRVSQLHSRAKKRLREKLSQP